MEELRMPANDRWEMEKLIYDFKWLQALRHLEWELQRYTNQLKNLSDNTMLTPAHRAARRDYLRKLIVSVVFEIDLHKNTYKYP